MIRRLAGTAILMAVVIEAIMIQIVAARSHRAWIVTRTVALLTEIAARTRGPLASMIAVPRIAVHAVGPLAHRRDTRIMALTMDRRITI